MERSRASKKKFQMRSPFKGSISEFMAMGRSLGNSKTSDPVAIDPSKHYKPSGKEKEEKESAVDQDKRETAEGRNKARADKNKTKQKPQDVTTNFETSDLTTASMSKTNSKNNMVGTDINAYKPKPKYKI